MATMSITSNDGALASASAVLEVSATNPAYNQPALHIKQAGTSGGAASIRIDDPNPDIEFVESDQVAPAGKYEGWNTPARNAATNKKPYDRNGHDRRSATALEPATDSPVGC
jgi:hypothetical protein